MFKLLVPLTCGAQAGCPSLVLVLQSVFARPTVGCAGSQGPGWARTKQHRAVGQGWGSASCHRCSPQLGRGICLQGDPSSQCCLMGRREAEVAARAPQAERDRAAPQATPRKLGLGKLVGCKAEMTPPLGIHETVSGQHTDSEEPLHSQAPDGRITATQGPRPVPSLQGTTMIRAQFQ